MKFILLINVKMPTIVGILTIMSRININTEWFKQEKIFIFFSILVLFFKQLKFHAQFSWAVKKFHNLEIRPRGYKTWVH